MKTCPHCAETIQDAAIICKHCQRPLVGPSARKASGALAIFLVVGGVILLVLLIGIVGPDTSRTSGINVGQARDLIDRSVRAGYITDWTCTGNTAHVTPAFWLAIDAKTKEGLLLSLARVCDAQQSGDRMTILDARSGRTLASYTGGTVNFQ